VPLQVVGRCDRELFRLSELPQLRGEIIRDGVVFGAMMGTMGMLPMIGKMAGYPSDAFGFLVHMGVSAVIGGNLRTGSW